MELKKMRKLISYQRFLIELYNIREIKFSKNLYNNFIPFVKNLFYSYVLNIKLQGKQ